MLLGFLERMALLTILPREGNIVTLKIVRQLREELAPSEEEATKYGIDFNERGVSWKTEPPEKEIIIGEKATDIVVRALKDADAMGKLTESHISVYEKFIKEG